jgi:hypothetical protein
MALLVQHINQQLKKQKLGALMLFFFFFLNFFSSLTIYIIWIQNRFLHLILYTAERAWSHAMEKKQLRDGPNARQRIYLIGRMRKAVKWATLFS